MSDQTEAAPREKATRVSNEQLLEEINAVHAALRDQITLLQGGVNAAQQANQQLAIQMAQRAAK